MESKARFTSFSLKVRSDARNRIEQATLFLPSGSPVPWKRSKMETGSTSKAPEPTWMATFSTACRTTSAGSVLSTTKAKSLMAGGKEPKGLKDTAFFLLAKNTGSISNSPAKIGPRTSFCLLKDRRMIPVVTWSLFRWQSPMAAEYPSCHGDSFSKVVQFPLGRDRPVAP